MLATGVFSSGGSTPARTTAARAAPATSHARRASSKHHSTAAVAGAANPSEIAVGVLNGTETPQLAHHAASELVGKGFSKAVALVGKPEGSNQVSVVEYTSGHHADAAAVASSLGISTVQPIEGSTAALAGSATVAVVIGQDKASSGT
jgi:LytR cell envelope-related transcriptional attenuator